MRNAYLYLRIVHSECPYSFLYICNTADPRLLSRSRFLSFLYTYVIYPLILDSRFARIFYKFLCIMLKSLLAQHKSPKMELFNVKSPHESAAKCAILQLIHVGLCVGVYWETHSGNVDPLHDAQTY